MMPKLALTFSLLLFSPLVLAQSPRPLVVGHRGLMHLAPENTLSAFRACLALRVGFEFDVRRCQTGDLVCLHDADLKRTTDGRGALAEISLAELKKLDAGSSYDRAFHGEGVPTIDEILRLVVREAKGEIMLAVDLKDTGNGLEQSVVEMAKSHGVLDRLLFIGATIESPQVRQRLKQASSKAQVARLASTPEQIDNILAEESIDWAYLRFIPTAADAKRIHAAGKRIFVAGPLFAGNEPKNWTAAAGAGVDAILTDFPLELRTMKSADQ
jgi:glycerophosphoryl diester phosphodiesterase